MEICPSRTTVDSAVARLNGGMFAAALPRPAKCEQPPSTARPHRARVETLRIQRRAVGRWGTALAFGAAFSVMAGCFAALGLAGRAMVTAPEEASRPPMILAPTFLEADPPPLAAAMPVEAVPAMDASPHAPSMKATAPNTAIPGEPSPIAKAKPSEIEAVVPPPGDDVMSARSEGDDGHSINTSAASAAIEAAAGGARGCFAADDPRSTMQIRVTFAPSGQATTAMVSRGPFAGTEIGSCIARAFRTAKVARFEGPPVTVSRWIRIR